MLDTTVPKEDASRLRYLLIFPGNQQKAAGQALDLVDFLGEAPSTLGGILLQAFDAKTRLGDCGDDVT